MNALFPVSLKLAKKSRLQETVLRDLGGGWNAVDDDISMQPNYFKELKNFHRNPNGSQRLRYGYNRFSNIASVVGGNIVDMDYFVDVIIAVTTAGDIASIDGLGVASSVWDDAIAAALPGAPLGWSGGLDSIDFVQFKRELIIHNGVDKPVSVDSDLNTTYLVDAGTGSNVNVPIGKYGCVVSDYHCVAGIPSAPTTIYVSSKGTSGTFPGDPIPNDSITIDVGAYAPEGASEIRGIAGFRTNLIVFFRGTSLVVGLGNYNATGVHEPTFPDTLPQYGLLGHRCFTLVDQDLLFAGLNGISSAKRNLFSGLLDSVQMTGLIEPDYRTTLSTLTDEQTLKSCFMLFDPMAHDMQLHTPTGRVFVRSSQQKLDYESWSEYTAVTYSCGCTSFLGRVFVARGTKIFQQGNSSYAGENYTADNMNDYEAVWAKSTGFTAGQIVLDVITPDNDVHLCYVCRVSHTSGVGTFVVDRLAHPTFWRLYVGNKIPFVMEFPWIEGRNPMMTKILRFLSMATKGTGEFTIDVYVDNLYKDINGNVMHEPALTADFVGNDAQGFGIDEGFPTAEATSYSLRTDSAFILRPDGTKIIRLADDGEGPFGGGRRSKDPRLYGTPVKFKMIKFRISGSTRKFLEFINLVFLFAKGGFTR